jgi:hypothetical protein
MKEESKEYNILIKQAIKKLKKIKTARKAYKGYIMFLLNRCEWENEK